MKLNLGSGDIVIPGYENLDAKFGDSIFPLPHESGSIDEIRASHVLEHFPHCHVQSVVNEWTRVLKPGGLLKVAVPNFKSIAQNYLAGVREPTQGYLMGGQVDAYDYHRAIFDADTLESLLRTAGLVSVNGWESDANDCASLPISLNGCGWKRPQVWPKVHALMSVPRLGFMDAFFCWYEALIPLQIPLHKYTGAFWGQCLERGFEQVLRESDPEYLLTLDYDTVFERQDIEDMLMVMVCNPHIDALAPIQSARSKDRPLFVIRGDDGKALGQVSTAYFKPTHARAHTAHFGCTLIRTTALKDMPRPWFHSRPGPDGAWNEGREDDDIYFWARFAEAGKQLYLASRVSVGHLELMIRWPNAEMGAMYQHHSEYAANGMPPGVWQ